MTAEVSPHRKSRSATEDLWRSLVAAFVVAAVAWGGMVYAANQSVQGAKKEEGGFDGDAPTAILMEATSGSVLFEKNADELRAPSSMMKLMTAEVVFHAIKQGDVKLNDEYHVSENAWRKGGAPSGTSTLFPPIHIKMALDHLLPGARSRCEPGGLSASTTPRIRTTAGRKRRKCWNGDFSILRRVPCSQPSSRPDMPSCLAATAARRRLRAPNRSR